MWSLRIFSEPAGPQSSAPPSISGRRRGALRFKLAIAFLSSSLVASSNAQKSFSSFGPIRALQVIFRLCAKRDCWRFRAVNDAVAVLPQRSRPCGRRQSPGISPAALPRANQSGRATVPKSGPDNSGFHAVNFSIHVAFCRPASDSWPRRA